MGFIYSVIGRGRHNGQSVPRERKLGDGTIVLSDTDWLNRRTMSSKKNASDHERRTAAEFESRE
jgi:hypothetical protein